MAHPSISMSDAMLEMIDERVGVDRSGWIREAIELRIILDEYADAHPSELPDDWWQDAVEAYLDEREQQPASIEA